MSLLFAISSVFLALIFYAISLFWEFSQRAVTRKILVFFWLGFVFDLTGTILMALISQGFALNAHSLLGISALLLMGIKAVWSAVYFQSGSGKRVPSAYTIFSALIWAAVFLLGFFRT